MFQNLLANWKTTSAGLAMIAGSVIHLIFKIKSKTADESTWNTTVLAVLAGVGLLAAGDAAKSVTKEQADTTFVKKPDVAPLTDTTPKIL
jgi:hypothetical protein